MLWLLLLSSGSVSICSIDQADSFQLHLSIVTAKIPQDKKIMLKFLIFWKFEFKWNNIQDFLWLFDNFR